MEIPHRIYLSPHVRESRTVLDSGFHDVDSGFRVLDSGFRHSGFRIPKRAGFHFFPGFNAFLRTSFSCPNLGILKEVVRRHNKFVFFFDLQKTGKKCITVRVRVYGIIMRGTLGDSLHRNTAEKNNEHRITAKKRSETPTSQFKVLSYD